MAASRLFPLFLLGMVVGSQGVTLYEYFTPGVTGEGITAGLEARDRNTFHLNGLPLKIFSGSLHYFRVHPDYWRDRLRKFRAAGLNTVDVYVPWNLHEPEKGVFDFGNGGRDFSAFLDLPRFIQMAQEEDLFVVFRPGPYICGEWEFGGIPSWLLHEHPMFVRTSFSGYQERANIFISEVVSRVKDLQWYTAAGSAGGPIIMTQVENEYGHFGYDDYSRDTVHLENLKQTLLSAGIETILFTSDSPDTTYDYGSIPGELMTANFKFGGKAQMDRLLQLQPNKPIFVTEYWPGWFDHWFAPFHVILTVESFETILQEIFDYQGSVNFYMFHGGTNFGFMNGGNVLDVWPFYANTITSYDYDAPLTESGNYTVKYDRAAEMIAAYDPIASYLDKPERPPIVPATAYPEVQLTDFIPYSGILERAEYVLQADKAISMEQLPEVNNGNGQSYGYVVYRTVVDLPEGSTILMRGHVRDLLQLMVEGKQVNSPLLSISDLTEFGSWANRDAQFEVTGAPCTVSCQVDFFVENLGRANFGKPHQLDHQMKGLMDDVYINGVKVAAWDIFSLEFKNTWVQSLTGWQPYNRNDNLDYAPRILKGTLAIAGTPTDTYFDFDCADGCADWLHGAVFVNGFNVGRYFQAGPTKTLYIPGPLLQQGDNEIIVMENYLGSDRVQFTTTPVLGLPIENRNADNPLLGVEMEQE